MLVRRGKTFVFYGAALIAFILMAGISWAMLFWFNTFFLDIQLAGEEEMRLEYGQVFQEPGVHAVLRGTVFCQEGIVPPGLELDAQGHVNQQELGQYPVTYTASCWWLKATAQRIVTVVDTQPPELSLTENGPVAMDNCDGDITDQIRRQDTPGLITYSVSDGSGNTASIQQEVPLEDQPPVIHLEGGDHITVPAGVPYQDPGYWAEDEREDLTREVQVSGEVTWYLCGTYPVTYWVTDSQGNETQVQRIVEVIPQQRPKVVYPSNGTIYLTFDDGPGPYTMKLLDILDEYDVKATFFVTNSGYEREMAEIVRRGHSIGIHTVTHDYQSIYSSPEAFFADLLEMQQIIEQTTGVKTTLMRFPGGSSNTISRHACKGIMTTLTQAVQDAGFQYFDWNIDSDDAGSARKPKTVASNVKEGLLSQGTGIVLQHDIHDYSVDAVEAVIQWALENGFHFDALSQNSPGYHHGVNN